MIQVAEVVLVETDHGDVAETFVFVAFLWLESQVVEGRNEGRDEMFDGAGN